MLCPGQNQEEREFLKELLLLKVTVFLAKNPGKKGNSTELKSAENLTEPGEAD